MHRQLSTHTYQALSYSHKLSGLPDPTQLFYIAQMLKGHMGKRLSFRKRLFYMGKRLSLAACPLTCTLPILHSLLEASPQITGSEYQMFQFKAMCSLASFAILRIGGITTTRHTCCLPLQMNQLAKVYDSSNQVFGMKN